MRARARTILSGVAFTILAFASPGRAQAPPEVRGEFSRWAAKSLHPVSDQGLDGSTEDLRPLVDMLGKARIVGLSEGQHAAVEPLIFRNRLFKHLVERQGFRAIALESGIVEGRVLNQFVTEGKGELAAVLERGLSWGSHTFRQNGELLRWVREYNARLPAGADKVQIYGLDVPGSPGNFDAVRRPDTALESALEYLRAVDPPEAARIQSRVSSYLPVLAGINGYGELQQPQRDALTAAIADLISHLERQQLAYVAQSSKEDFDWAERAAIGARQADNWFRQMPVGWKFEDGFAWTRFAMQVRDRSMADNLEWVLGRLKPRARVLVFTAVGHMASTNAMAPTSPFREMVPMGAYLADRHGADFVNILNLVANGEIRYCSAKPQRVIPLAPPPESAVERLFMAAGVPRYVLDLRRAPPAVSSWLSQVHDHWNGSGSLQFATAQAFDLVYYVSPITSACHPES